MRDEKGLMYICIALGILKQVKNEASRFRWPAPLTIRVTILSLSSTTNTTAKPSEGDGLLVSNNIFKVPFSLNQRQLPYCKSSFPGILFAEVELKIRE